ncbi:MAG: squalene/phytoene synthase family protein [Pseudomonadota bacterium]
MANPPSTEQALDWCRSRMLVPGSSLALTLPYAEQSLRNPILALRTVISEIASVPDEVSDADVARRKLDWWRQALAEMLPHPAVLALAETGAAGAVRLTDWYTLIDAVTLEITAPRFEQVHEWHTHCEQLAGPGALLEARLVEALEKSTPEPSSAQPASSADPDHALTQLAAAGYRIRSVRDLVLDARHHRWWLPLELQAEYQLTRTQVASGEGGHRFDALVRQLIADAVEQQRKAQQAIEPEVAWLHRHQILSATLDRRLAGMIVRKPSRIVQQRLLPAGPLASFKLWRAARNLMNDS